MTIRPGVANWALTVIGRGKVSIYWAPATGQPLCRWENRLRARLCALVPHLKCGGAELQTQLHGTSGKLWGLLYGSEAASNSPTPVVFIFEESGQDHQCLTGCFGSSMLSPNPQNLFPFPSWFILQFPVSCAPTVQVRGFAPGVGDADTVLREL